MGRGFDGALDVILNSAHSPVFHLWEHGIGQGLLGGKIISQFEQGRIAGELAMAILNGQEVSSVPVVSGEAANRYVVDHKVLARFAIPSELLPESTQIRNKPYGFYERYRTHILLVAGCAVILLPVSLSLFVIIIRLRESKAALETSNARLSVLFEESPLGMILFDDKGEILDCNGNSLDVMGATRSQIIGFNTALNSTPKMRKAIARTLDGVPSVYEGEYTSVTGKKTSVIRVRFNPVLTDSKITQIIATLEDVGRSPRQEC